MPKQEDYIVEASQQGGNGIKIRETKRSGRAIMYVFFIGIILVNFAVLYYVRRRMKREVDTAVNEQVGTVVQQYFALSSTNTDDQ